MKLIIATLKDSDADEVTQALTAGEYRITRVSSTGGFLRRGVVSLLIGLEDERVEDAIQIIHANVSRSVEDESRGTIFVLPVKKFTQV